MTRLSRGQVLRYARDQIRRLLGYTQEEKEFEELKVEVTAAYVNPPPLEAREWSRSEAESIRMPENDELLMLDRDEAMQDLHEEIRAALAEEKK